MRSLAIVIACIFLFSCGAKPVPPFPHEITATKGPNHVNIPGTSVFMVLPEDFSISDKSQDIQKGNAVTIHIDEIEDGNFYADAGVMSRENYKEQGIDLLEFKDLKVNGYPARIAFFKRDKGTNVYNLAFGDTSFCIMAVAIIKSADSEATEQVREALQSIYFDKTYKIDAFASAPFELDDSQSGFKLAKHTEHGYWYSIGGVKKHYYENEPYFMALPVSLAGKSMAEIADSEATAMTDRMSRNESRENTNGLRSYQRELYGKMYGKPAAMFQHIVLIGDKAIIMQGVADMDFNKNIAEFKKLSGTIKPNRKER